jgi:NDP-sugar pyrophosphorylase family protein
VKVVILAGGQGKRLRPLTDKVPKPLVEINGRAIVDYRISAFRELGVTSFVILAGYKQDVLVKHFEQGYEWADVAFSFEDKPLGTGGAIKSVEKQIGGEDFVVINGDIMTDLDFAPMLENNTGLVGKIALVPLRSPYGIVNTDETRVVGFEEKPLLEGIWINAGVYWFANAIFDYLPEAGEIEKTAFPELAMEKQLGFYKFGLGTGFWRSIDTLKDYEEVEKLLKQRRE